MRRVTTSSPAAPFPVQPLPPHQSHHGLRRTSYLGFVLIGMVATSFGPALPALGREFHLGLAGQAGLLLVEALAYGVATFIGGAASDVLGRKRLFLAAATLTTLGAAGLAIAPTWFAMLATGMLTGIGAGMIDSLTNALFLDLTSGDEGSAGSLNLLHAFFGLGALVEPGIAAIVLGHNWSWRLLFVCPALVGLALIVASLATTFLPVTQDGGVKPRAMALLLARPAFLLLAATLAIYSGGELVATDWMVTYHGASAPDGSRHGGTRPIFLLVHASARPPARRPDC